MKVEKETEEKQKLNHKSIDFFQKLGSEEREKFHALDVEIEKLDSSHPSKWVKGILGFFLVSGVFRALSEAPLLGQMFENLSNMCLLMGGMGLLIGGVVWVTEHVRECSLRRVHQLSWVIRHHPSTDQDDWLRVMGEPSVWPASPVEAKEFAEWVEEQVEDGQSTEEVLRFFKTNQYISKQCVQKTPRSWPWPWVKKEVSASDLCSIEHRLKSWLGLENASAQDVASQPIQTKAFRMMDEIKKVPNSYK